MVAGAVAVTAVAGAVVVVDVVGAQQRQHWSRRRPRLQLLQQLPMNTLLH